ncbi:MAG: ester cyclase [Pseudonocardiales bacterium]|nr:ester cyclase [Pseudonocardiales bacterium]PZS31198.1 MAG: ester cyclase [Pseudonocardiales bacterium]
MTRDANIATQEKGAQHLNAGDIDAFVDTLFAQDCVDHDPAPGQGPGRDGFRSFFRTLTTAFPDAQIEPATLVADGEHVALAYTLTGTHNGDFHGVAATSKRIEVRGLQIGRFRDGQIVERWGSTDELGIMQQIGATPSPDSAKPGVLGKVADAFRT